MTWPMLACSSSHCPAAADLIHVLALLEAGCLLLGLQCAEQRKHKERQRNQKGPAQREVFYYTFKTSGY